LTKNQIPTEQYINSLDLENPVSSNDVQEVQRYLTGNQETDKNIISFFQTKSELSKALKQ